jgi:hypothetical protein
METIKVLSFDVGIKNLAYCLLEFNQSYDISFNNKYTIKKWGIINMLAELEDAALKCSFVKKGGVLCNKVAKCHVNNNGVNIGFCSNKTCLKYLETNYGSLEKKNTKKVLTKQISLFDLGTKIINELEKETDFLEADEIVIENQPVLKNPTMKSVQMFIYSYFIMKNKSKKLDTINLFSAKNKLNIYDGPELDIKKSSEYATRKALSIEYTKYFLKNNTEKLNWFIEHKKKDDLGDCFLQGLTYYSKSKYNKIPKVPKIKVNKKTTTKKEPKTKSKNIKVNNE